MVVLTQISQFLSYAIVLAKERYMPLHPKCLIFPMEKYEKKKPDGMIQTIFTYRSFARTVA